MDRLSIIHVSKVEGRGIQVVAGVYREGNPNKGILHIPPENTHWRRLANAVKRLCEIQDMEYVGVDVRQVGPDRAHAQFSFHEKESSDARLPTPA